MAHQPAAFSEALYQARVQKGWSQRDLGQRAGVPQAHISKIERGQVDMRMSTLVQLARLLDLEPVLVPRSALLAVQAIVREADAEAPARAVREAARGLSVTAERIRQEDAPSADRLALLASGIAVLAAHPPAPSVASALLDSMRDVQASAADSRKLRRALKRLVDLRNAVEHGLSAVRPAYTLDDED